MSTPGAEAQELCTLIPVGAQATGWVLSSQILGIGSVDTYFKHSVVVTKIMVNCGRYKSTVLAPRQRHDVRVVTNGGRNGSFS